MKSIDINYPYLSPRLSIDHLRIWGVRKLFTKLNKKPIKFLTNMKQIKIKNRTIGDNFPAFIVAEMAWSHDGSLGNTRKIVKVAPDAKADAIKFHITSLEDAHGLTAHITNPA